MGKPLQHPGTDGGHRYHVHFAAFSPDGKTVLAAANTVREKLVGGGSGPGFQSEVQLWDAATGTPLGKPLNFEFSVRHVVFSPDSKYFATERAQSLRGKTEIQLWDAVKRTHLGSLSTAYNNGFVFTQDSKKLLVGAAGDGGKTEGLWLDTANGKPAGSPLDFKEPFYLAGFHPNGELITSGGGARLWDVKKGTPVGERLRHARGYMVA